MNKMYNQLLILVLFLISITLQAQVGINTTLSGTSTRTLEVYGGLRVAEIYPALVTATTIIGNNRTITTELPLETEDYDKVLVTDLEGNIDHINIEDFYAFSSEYAKYEMVTATYYYLGDYTAKHEEVLEGSIISIGWIDFCVQYINDAGEWLELKYRPNEKDRAKDSNGKYIKNQKGEYVYDDFLMSATVTHNFFSAFRQYTEIKKNIASANNAPWYFFTSGSGGVYYNRIGRGPKDLGTKRLSISFFREDLNECYLMDILISTHKPINPGEKPYISVIIWYSNPKYYHKN